jgi:CheY-like chemotaxis protein
VVLIVEADAFAREALEQILRGRGYAPVTAANGREALRRLRHGEPPALIVLDWATSQRGGGEFRRRCQKDPRLAHVPVVVLSADAELPPAQVADLRVAGHLQKPIVLEDLLRTVARWC